MCPAVGAFPLWPGRGLDPRGVSPAVDVTLVFLVAAPVASVCRPVVRGVDLHTPGVSDIPSANIILWDRICTYN